MSNEDLARRIRRLYLDGMGIPAIAQKLGLTIPEVRRALGRAR